MGLRSRQKGLGWFGLLIVFGLIGFFSVVTMKTLPLYLNEMKIKRAVQRVASEPELKNSESQDPIRKALLKWWIVEDINRVDWKDVKIKRTDQGRFLSYDYRAEERLFSNVYVSIHFKNDFRMDGGGND